MKRFFSLAALLLVTCCASGCHCLPGYECYNDDIDYLADNHCQMERHYHPCLDVTRWGRSDGPCCCNNKNCCR